jgi:DNA-directed RNA polymerase omega subunit
LKKPTLSELMQTNVNRYSLVLAIAKQARTIQANAEKKGMKLTEKPVILATDDIYRGMVKIIEK